MPWFKVDDALAEHPKVDELLAERDGPHALALWLLAGCWSASQLTDGVIPSGRVKRIPFGKKGARALVRVGLWEEIPEGYRFHDWADYQPSKADVLAKRASDAGRKARGRAQRVRPDSARTPPGQDSDSDESPPVPPRALTRPVPVPDPTRPVPDPTVLPDGCEGVVAPPPKQASLAIGGNGSAKPRKARKRKAKAPAPSSAAWDAYSAAYLERYGVAPARNARVNGQLANLVGRLGAEAPDVAAFFVEHNASWYVTKGHPVSALLADAESLRTQWATGVRTTRGDAVNAEKVDEFAAQSRRVAAMLEKAGRAAE